MADWMKRAAFLGLLGGFGALHVSLVGMVNTFQARDFIAGIVTVGSVMPMLIALLVGWRAGILPRTEDDPASTGRSLASGAIAGAVVGLEPDRAGGRRSVRRPSKPGRSGRAADARTVAP